MCHWTHNLGKNQNFTSCQLYYTYFRCHNPDGTLYIPDRQITEQIPSKQHPTEIPVQIAGGKNNNKFVSKKGKKTSFGETDGNSKSSSVRKFFVNGLTSPQSKNPPENSPVKTRTPRN